MKGQSFGKRLGFAINGLYLAFRRESSFRLQVFAAAGVLVVLLLTRPEIVWWVMGALAVGLVLVAELFNTALEVLADRIHPELHPEIRAVKDIAAGAVLVSSFVALLVAVAFLFR
ncbi:diacylglycerol kinase [Noviherbaspirillum sedimenti]|uniref:Diacylglycerol kinase n=1 Tax=Noviherbaspirillum sedimenti TaxID=2320865 RepID=A0A3A3G4M7_9BURK|nr:diacylglycerol kinase [Noviherbaspirillum sedimenti]RJG01462.1 diacylglycerol kinase [Noviherbaspirillum sedimenti]